MNRAAPRTTSAIAYTLLLLTIFVHIWAASTKPSAIIAALTVVVTAAYAVWSRDFPVHKHVRPVLIVACCLLLWAAFSTWINDQYPSHLPRLGQTTTGIAMLWAVGVTAIAVPRIRIVTAAIVAATFVSALVGIGILVQGEPFTSLWLRIAEVSELGIALGYEESVRIPSSGRTSGLAGRTSAFAYQLTVAIPLALGLLLIPLSRLFLLRHSGEGGSLPDCLKASRDEWILRGVAVVVLTGLTTVLVLNATRSALLGVFCGGLVALSPLLLKRPGLRRMPSLLSLAVVAVSTFAIVSLIEEGGAFNPRLFSVEDTSARARLPMAITAFRYAVEYPLGTVVYEPEPRHAPSGLDPVVLEEILSHTAHNQFLLVLVHYGWPGFALLALFYGVVLRALASSLRLALKLRTAESIVLVTSLAGSLVAYGCNSLFQPGGPVCWRLASLDSARSGVQRSTSFGPPRRTNGKQPYR